MSQQAMLELQFTLLHSQQFLILVAAQVLLADGRTVPFTAAAKKKIQAEVDTMAASALRCLAFAQRTDPPAFASYDGSLSHPVSSPHWAHPLHSTSWTLFADTQCDLPASAWQWQLEPPGKFTHPLCAVYGSTAVLICL